MTTNYSNMLQKGTEYQDFLMSKLITYGIIIMPYSSRKYQYNEGESYTRHEIKFDDRMAETGNLYIETAEKTNKNNEEWINSGINRNDNTIWFVIGNYDKVFVFAKKILKNIVDAKRKELRSVSTPTSQGILLPIEIAEKYATVIDLVNEKIY